MNKKVLIISYYWPPSGGSAVIRWLKFSKYLPEYGWQPIVFTPLNPEAPFQDEKLEKDIPIEAEIIKTKIWEPYNLFKIFSGVKKKDKIQVGFLSEKKKPSLMSKIGVYIRGNYFIPDARCFWIKPSIKKLTKYLKENPVDAIVSTGPPHSTHLIAMGLKEKLNIPWLADFRDPWTNIDFYPDLMLTAKSDRKHHKLEKMVAKKADVLVTIAKNMTQEFVEIGSDNTHTITNGFDGADSANIEYEHTNRFVISHTGTIAKSRNPEVLWKALSELVTENKELKEKLVIQLIGKIDASVHQFIEKYKLNEFIETEDFLPHDQIVVKQAQASVLLLLINNTPNAKGILTGKFFEYLSAKRPVLAIGPLDGEVAEILKNTSAGKISGYSDLDLLKSNILGYFEDYKNKKLNINSKGIDTFSRKNLTGDIVNLLNSITSN